MYRSQPPLLGVPFVFLLLALLPAPSAHALDAGPYTLEVLVDGRPRAEYAARGRTYVEAIEGREYSIRLTNRTGERIAVALSVDGLNTIDARTTTARDAAKWILDPYETVVLDGWQTGPTLARRFFFTTEARSYGAWLGRTKNLGVVSAAVFRERRRSPRPVWRGSSDAAPGAEEGGRESRADAPNEPSAALESEPDARDKASPPLSDEMAATGIGREVDHEVRRVLFLAEEHPAAVLELRYEYHDALVRLGVLPGWARADDPLGRRERARGFEGMEFAPDPYRR